jgi:hypothetical protein
MRSMRLLVLGLCAVMASIVFASNASAATVTLGSSGINEVGNGTVTFAGSSFGTDICTFTLRGTLSTSIAAPLGTTTRIGSVTGVTGGPLFGCSGAHSSVSFGSFPYGIDAVLTDNIVLTQSHNAVFQFLGGFGICIGPYNGSISGSTSIAGGTSSVINTSVATFGNLSGTASGGGCTGNVSGSVSVVPAVATRIIR